MDPAFYPYSNIGNMDEFFENTVIRRVHELNPEFKKVDYLGVTSWKQHQKTNLSGKEIVDYIQKDIDAGTEKDIYIYSPIQGLTLEFDNHWHGTIKDPDLWMAHKNRYEQIYNDDKLLNSSRVLPFDLFDGKWQYCHCNYWIAKPHIFDAYCKEVLIPAMDFFNRPEILHSMPKWFSHRHQGRKVTSICFTLEGLFGAFLAHSNYTFDYICKKKIRGAFKMVKVDGYTITNTNNKKQ